MGVCSDGWWSWKWIVLWSLWAGRLVRQPTTVVRISYGDLRGYIAPDGSHAAYLGIPYATYDSRFQPPRPRPPWIGVFEAVEENIRCAQRFSTRALAGQEDCLTLNVFTPPPSPEPAPAPLPVMVFIHGGGFRDGSGSTALYGPEYLVPHDVILVTINYRLEILGFLCLGIKEAPGNVGLKDQLEALKWIRRNIAAFGGDPDNVTLFGESAGAASVVYHLLSPLSEGLFHKAIMQSGSALSPWSFQWEPLKTASLLARHFDAHTENPYELYRLFMSKTVEELLRARVPRAAGDVVLSENVFVPCLEVPYPDSEAFLNDTPYNLLSNGKFTKVPMIIGHNDAEGWMFVGKENDTTIANFDFLGALPRDLEFPSKKEAQKVADKLQEIYVEGRKISKETMAELAQFEGDAGITFSVLDTVLLMLRSKATVYAYRFEHSGWMNLAKFAFGAWNVRGATHADELFYMFKPRLTLINSFMETDMIDKVSTLWTNFAKFGDPTAVDTAGLPQWKPATEDNMQALVIREKIALAPFWDHHNEAMTFWNQTYTKYRRKLANTLSEVVGK